MIVDLNNPEPLYRQIVENIKKKISSGEMQEGDLIGSQQEIAATYGVSLITARKAMAVLINEGLLIGRVGKGMYVSRKPKMVDYSKYKTVGLVLSDLRNPFFSLIIPSVEEKASENDYNVLLSASSSRIEKEESQIQRYMEIGVDGLIIASMKHEYRPTSIMKRLQKNGFPFVLVSYIEDPYISYVGTNHEKGGYLATEHLIKLGHKRIGYISAERGNLVALHRLHGFERAHHEYGQMINTANIHYMKWNNFESGYEMGEQILNQSSRADAFFVYSDLAALGFQKAILEKGMRIPDDIALVGFDNIDRASYAKIPLTTIHQPTHDIGIIAFEKLVKLIEGRNDEIRTILDPKLIIRISCGARQRDR